MNIGIIGTGSVGGTLGRILARCGHSVTFGTRDPQNEKVQSLLATINGTADATDIATAVASSEVVILAIPWNATQEAIASAGDLSGKILIDATNPIEMTPEGLAKGLLTGHTTSAAEELAQLAPGAVVIKAFNTIGASQFETPLFGTIRATGFICGDDLDAKQVVASLVEEVGFDVLDVGNLSQARLLEPLGMTWIHLAFLRGLGQEFAVTVIKRPN
ncbi:MAG: NADPH-dependent F420 reductase [Elainellaceae cyanobacterium]